MHLARCYRTHVSSISVCVCTMTRIMTTSKPQRPHGDPLIGSLCGCIQLDVIGNVELHLKHLESSVCRRLCWVTYTLDVDVPYLPWSATQFLWI
jgi:hypothetical protein